MSSTALYVCVCVCVSVCACLSPSHLSRRVHGVRGQWSLATGPGGAPVSDQWEAGAVLCPAGTTFAVPRSPRSNAALWALLQATGSAQVWIDMTDTLVPDCWVPITYICPYARVRRCAPLCACVSKSSLALGALACVFVFVWLWLVRRAGAWADAGRADRGDHRVHCWRCADPAADRRLPLLQVQRDETILGHAHL
jgi:hypothetical protein